MLFAQNAVVRIGLGKFLADQRLDVAIGLGNQVLVTLLRDRQRVQLAKILETEVPGLPGKGHGEIKPFIRTSTVSFKHRQRSALTLQTMRVGNPRN